jgi:hypothetical protein
MHWRAAIGGRHLLIQLPRTALCFALFFFGCSTTSSRADEGGTSFWLPGIFGSLAAVPQQPGWSLSTTYYHADVSAGGDVACAQVPDRQDSR